MRKIQLHLATNMKSLRGNRGLTQAKLALLVNTAPNYISQIEQGNKFPSPAMLEKLATALEVHSYELFLPSATEIATNLNEIHKKLNNNIEKAVRESQKEYFLFITKNKYLADEE